ncbi:hypothetical protein RGU72_04655 [Undibacterium sp. 5I1]|uniref:hypothetical protein n=1 Tax=unclassified Undibacterium TaxID=2630295 RepID=UPI002AB4EA08|nr:MULTISPECIES: hypothetical protein [unclassified Undibacterium]MDY7537542.1 hypothetical protein [Undibacterium sp. 5I1]MEB0231926.1 hypothetical protein [Undibacterium sp. 10I3]MEB0256277.1 hypothetical protein [Undibacterium sp. 5I1]
MKIVDLTGRTFGRLKVIAQDTYVPGKHKRWKCLCECGKKISFRGTSLTQEDVKSCGCLRKDRGSKSLTKHGLYYHTSYSTWSRMMTRCYNVKSADFPEYGGRGIIVCARWHDVANFIADMGVKPLGASIDRIENDKGYKPDNCRWSNPVEQANNTRKNVRVSFEGESMTIAEVARRADVNYKALHYLIHTKGLLAEGAVLTLVGKKT